MPLLHRLRDNPIITPGDVSPSRASLKVRCVINPAAFMHQGKIGLLLRVCEQPPQEPGWLCTAVRDPSAPDGVRILRFAADDPKLRCEDPRLFRYEDRTYLTTLSHLRLAWSDNGENFTIEPHPAYEGQGAYETYGVEDCRVTELEGHYHLTYTAVSEFGVAVGYATTTDFRHFERHGLIFPPHNKDCAIFPRRIGNEYLAIHRPSGEGIGGHFMWISRSADLQRWGQHKCVARTRSGMWDCQRIGINGPPIPTPQGWLVLYHGADQYDRYALGAMLLEDDDPTRLLARSSQPLLWPAADYETQGFMPNVVFSNGHICREETLTVYYGAADQCVAAARGSLPDVLRDLIAAGTQANRQLFA